MLPPSQRDFKDIYVVFELMETDLHQVGAGWVGGARGWCTGGELGGAPSGLCTWVVHRRRCVLELSGWVDGGTRATRRPSPPPHTPWCCCCLRPSQVIKANDDLTPEHHQFFLYQMLRGLKYIHSAKVRWGGGIGWVKRVGSCWVPRAGRRAGGRAPCPHPAPAICPPSPGVPPRFEAQEHPRQLGLQAQDLRLWAGAPRFQRHAAGACVCECGGGMRACVKGGGQGGCCAWLCRVGWGGRVLRARRRGPLPPPAAPARPPTHTSPPSRLRPCSGLTMLPLAGIVPPSSAAPSLQSTRQPSTSGPSVRMGGCRGGGVWGEWVGDGVGLGVRVPPPPRNRTLTHRAPPRPPARRLHLCRDPAGQAALPWPQRGAPAGADHRPAGHPSARGHRQGERRGHGWGVGGCVVCVCVCV